MERLSGIKTKEVLGPVQLIGLHYYPIKSCGGTELSVAEIGPRGILHDREFMVVDPSTNEFKTQRKDMRLALVRPSLEGEMLKLIAPGMQDLIVPVKTEGEIRKSIVWEDTTDSIDQGNEAAQWFSEFLKKDCRLVRMADGYVRQVNQQFAMSETDQVGFADGYPFLLTSIESLVDLNRRILGDHPDEKVIPMNRFRPTIVVSGAGIPFVEDEWKEIQIGDTSFVVAKLCARCPIPTTDQDTAARGKEPMRTLLSFRPRNADGFPYFGVYLIHKTTGLINSGERLQITA